MIISPTLAFVSSRIYWKWANEDATDVPQSFLDFRNADSVELVRLEDGAWSDVDSHIKVGNYNGRRRIIVRGRPHGPMRLRRPLSGGDVQVVILLNAPAQFEFWVSRIGARIAPWKLLQEEVKRIANQGTSCMVEEIGNALGFFYFYFIGITHIIHCLGRNRVESTYSSRTNFQSKFRIMLGYPVHRILMRCIGRPPVGFPIFG